MEEERNEYDFRLNPRRKTNFRRFLDETKTNGTHLLFEAISIVLLLINAYPLLKIMSSTDIYYAKACYHSLWAIFCAKEAIKYMDKIK
jgi:hypothetical protein